MGAEGSWGEPFRFERAGAPLAAAVVSVLSHLALLVFFLPGRTPARRSPAVAAKSGEIALVLQGPADPAPAETASRRVERPASRAVEMPLGTDLSGPMPRAVEMPVAALERAPVELLERWPASIPARAEPLEAAPAAPGVRAPRLASGEGRPRYPSGCRSGLHRPGGCEGRGAYEVEVDESGRALSVRVRESAGCAELDRSAVEFLAGARFEPATDGLRTVAWRGVLFVRFRLDEGRGADDKRP